MPSNCGRVAVERLQSLTERPDRNGNSAARAEHPMHLTCDGDAVRHRGKPLVAEDDVDGPVGEADLRGRAFERVDSCRAGLRPGRHVRRQHGQHGPADVAGDHLAAGPDSRCCGTRHGPGAGGNVEHGLPTRCAGILDQAPGPGVDEVWLQVAAIILGDECRFEQAPVWVSHNQSPFLPGRTERLRCFRP